MAAERISIIIDGRAHDYVAATEEAKLATRSLGREVDSVNRRTSSGFSSSSSAIGGFATKALLALPAVNPLLGAIGALTASAGAAAAGVGALAVGGGAAGAVGLAGLAAVAVPAIAAVKKVTSAQTAYTLAVQQYGKASKEASTARKALTAQENIAGSGATMMARQVSALARRWKELSAPAQSNFFDVVGLGIQRVNNLLPLFARSAQRSMAALRGGFQAFLKQATGPEFSRFINVMTRTFAQSAKPLGDAFGQIAKMLERIAVAAAPDVIKMAHAFDSMIRGWVRSTKDAGQLRDTVHGLVENTRAWGHLVEAAAKLIIATLVPGVSQGKEAVRQLTGQLHQWTDWVNAHPKEIRDFFRQGLATTKQLAQVLVGFIPQIIQVSRAMQPIATAMLAVTKALNSIHIGDVSALTVLLGVFVAGRLASAVRETAVSFGLLAAEEGAAEAGAVAATGPIGALVVAMGLAATAGAALESRFHLVAHAAGNVTKSTADAMGGMKNEVHQDMVDLATMSKKDGDKIVNEARHTSGATAKAWVEAYDRLNKKVKIDLSGMAGANKHQWARFKQDTDLGINHVLNAFGIFSQKSKQHWGDAIQGIEQDVKKLTGNLFPKLNQSTDGLLSSQERAAGRMAVAWDRAMKAITTDVNLMLGAFGKAAAFPIPHAAAGASAPGFAQGGIVVPGKQAGDHHLLSLDGVPIGRVGSGELVSVANPSATAALMQVNSDVKRGSIPSFATGGIAAAIDADDGDDPVASLDVGSTTAPPPPTARTPRQRGPMARLASALGDINDRMNKYIAQVTKAGVTPAQGNTLTRAFWREIETYTLDDQLVRQLKSNSLTIKIDDQNASAAQALDIDNDNLYRELEPALEEAIRQTDVADALGKLSNNDDRYAALKGFLYPKLSSGAQRALDLLNDAGYLKAAAYPGATGRGYVSWLQDELEAMLNLRNESVTGQNTIGTLTDMLGSWRGVGNAAANSWVDLVNPMESKLQKTGDQLKKAIPKATKRAHGVEHFLRVESAPMLSKGIGGDVVRKLKEVGFDVESLAKETYIVRFPQVGADDDWTKLFNNQDEALHLVRAHLADKIGDLQKGLPTQHGPLKTGWTRASLMADAYNHRKGKIGKLVKLNRDQKILGGKIALDGTEDQVLLNNPDSAITKLKEAVVFWKDRLGWMTGDPNWHLGSRGMTWEPPWPSADDNNSTLKKLDDQVTSLEGFTIGGSGKYTSSLLDAIRDIQGFGLDETQTVAGPASGIPLGGLGGADFFNVQDLLANYRPTLEFDKGTMFTGGIGAPGGDTTLADLIAQQNALIAQNIFVTGEQTGIFSSFFSELRGGGFGMPFIGQFARGITDVRQTGLAVLHTGETVTPDPEGPFGNSLAARTVGGDGPTELRLVVAESPDQMVRVIDARIDGRKADIVRTVDQRIGRRAREIAYAPGRSG